MRDRRGRARVRAADIDYSACTKHKMVTIFFISFFFFSYQQIGLTVDDGLYTKRLYNQSRLILCYKYTRRNCQIMKLKALPAFLDVLRVLTDFSVYLQRSILATLGVLLGRESLANHDQIPKKA